MRYITGSRRLMLGEAMSIFARSTCAPSGNAADFIFLNSAEENLELFRKMKAAAFPDGAHVLRAKIDMASPNINLRDPVMYRIRHAHHHRTGDKWCIYPTYDWAHGLSDCIESVTHSLCT